MHTDIKMCVDVTLDGFNKWLFWQANHKWMLLLMEWKVSSNGISGPKVNEISVAATGDIYLPHRSTFTIDNAPAGTCLFCHQEPRALQKFTPLQNTACTCKCPAFVMTSSRRDTWAESAWIRFDCNTVYALFLVFDLCICFDFWEVFCSSFFLNLCFKGEGKRGPERKIYIHLCTQIHTYYTHAWMYRYECT